MAQVVDKRMSERIRQCGYNNWVYCDGDCYNCFRHKSKTVTSGTSVTINGVDMKYANKVVAGESTTHWHKCSLCNGPVDIGDTYCKHCGARFI